MGRMRKLIYISILPLVISGCTTTIEATSERLDNAEQAIRLGRIHYQERFDRISMEWICTGMSWVKLIELTGGNQTLIDAIIEACAERTFPRISTESTNG